TDVPSRPRLASSQPFGCQQPLPARYRLERTCPVPFRNAAWRPIDATAKAPFVRSRFLLEGAVCVAFHFFHRLNVNPAFRLLDELFPALLSRQWRTLTIAKVKVCFQLGQFRVDGKV